jgi:urease accessory protein
MLRVSHRLGNIHTDRKLATTVHQWQQTGQLEEINIEERHAHKSRFRLHTTSGREIGFVLPRETTIADGDIFGLKDEAGGLLVHISLQEVMVLSPQPPTDAAEGLKWAVRLGHVLGNQHWPIAVVGEQILVPVTLDRAVMETVLRTHHLTEHFTLHYEQRAWPQD